MQVGEAGRGRGGGGWGRGRHNYVVHGRSLSARVDLRITTMAGRGAYDTSRFSQTKQTFCGLHQTRSAVRFAATTGGGAC